MVVDEDIGGGLDGIEVEVEVGCGVVDMVCWTLSSFSVVCTGEWGFGRFFNRYRSLRYH